MPYDKTSAESIEIYGKRLIGANLSDVLGINEVPLEEKNKSISGTTRGSLGTIVEKYYFGIEPENDGTPDFPEAGVELKTTPIKKNKKGEYTAKERLVLGMINYIEEAEKDFAASTYFKKNQKLMLLSYLHEENRTIGDVNFLLARLYEFNKLPKEDQKIIREDWKKINDKIRANLAHELSEGDTLYLAACTKSATSANRRPQVDGPPAKPRAFSYKPSYMTQLLKREFGVLEDEEKILSEAELSENKTFEQQVLEKFSPFVGKRVSEIASLLELELNPKQKDKFAKLARAMMGVKKSKVEEFEAAGVRMKTIQAKADGTPKESMSFPTFKYTDVINEVWDGDEDEGVIRSAFQKQLESRFLFVVYRCEDKCTPTEERIFETAFFWTMPAKDLLVAQKVWEETLQLINEGKIVKNIKQNKKGENIRETFFPSSSDNEVAHVRPHGSNAADTYLLPVSDILTGEDAYTKHCFWLNINYLKGVISSHKKDNNFEKKGQHNNKPTISPYAEKMISIPLYDSIGCGELMLADSNSDESIEVPAWLIKPGAKYFALHTKGDSMNQLDINDGDIILCQKNLNATTGNAVILIGDDAALKQIKVERDGLLLIPKSTNPEHRIRKLTADDEFKILGVFVCKIDIER